MRKQWYSFRIVITGILVGVAPPVLFLLVVRYFFPPGDYWAWFFWSLGTFSAWIVSLAGVAQLLGSSLPQWIGWDVVRILHAFERTTTLTLDGVQDRLPSSDHHLERKEVQEGWKALEQGRPILIVGESGSGKSAIVAAIVRRAQKRGIPTLFLDPRNYSVAVSTFGDLEHWVGVPMPLRDSLETLVNRLGRCLLAIDQLDSVVGTSAFQVSVEFLAAAVILEQARVVAASCVLDAVEYKPVRELSFDIIESSPLDRERVATLLREMGVDTPSGAVLTLSQNLFYLSLVADLAKQLDISQVEGEVALLDRYQAALVQNDGADVVQAAIDLAYEKLDARRTDFTLPRVQGRALQRLQNRGVIIPVGHGLYRFRHEQLLYYFYAQGAIERDVSPATVLGQIAGRRTEEVLVWVLRVYHYRRMPQLTEYLGEALTGSVDLDFYEKAALLDEILTWEGIVELPTVVDVVLRAISLDASLGKYFFRYLAASENPEWFEPLRQRRVFEASPEPVEGDGEIYYPTWFALWYLIAVASKLPDETVEVARTVRTQDPHVMLELVRAAQRMPPEHAAQVGGLAIRWADEGMKIEESVTSLATYLVGQAKWEDAFELVDLILSPQVEQVSVEIRKSPFYFPRVTSRTESYPLQMFVERELAFFLEHRPLGTLVTVERNLEKAIQIEGHDTSSVWRPAIETHEQNLRFGEIKGLLVKAVVRALEAVVKNTPDKAGAILEGYLRHPYSIFRRLAIHAVRANARQWPDLLERLFTEQNYLDDKDVHHEYWMLMHDTYSLLPESVQDDFASQIVGRLPPEQIKDTMEYSWKRYAVLRQLWAVKDHLSSRKHRKLLDELVSEYGEPEHPDFLSYSSRRVGSTSPKTPRDLSQMSADKILVELKKKLPFDSFGGPTQEGLARALEAAIVSTPQHFAPIAPKLLDSEIPPICTSEALRGFRDAWKEGKSFDWIPVLELCSKVAKTTGESKSVEGETPPDMSSGYFVTTYAAARSAVAELLEVGIVRNDRAIEPGLLDQVRDILLVLAHDLNPSPEYEHNLLTEYSYDVLTVALNVTRGKAVEALIRYALHLARISEPEIEESEAAVCGSRMEKQVKDKLTEKLDKQADPSLAVHSLFGKYFPNLHYLDKQWANAHLEDIFPRQPGMSAYWEAAWDGYLFRSDFFGYLYRILKPYYRYAIEQMALGAQGKAGSEFSRRRLAAHLAALYWRGIETLEDDESLVPLFFDSAPDSIRSRFVTSLGTALREVKPRADSEEWVRVKTLWVAGVQVIVEATNGQTEKLAGFVNELGAFSRWVPYIPENLEDFYSMIELSGLVAERGNVIDLLRFLGMVAKEHAHFVVSFLEKLLNRERDFWFWGPNSKVVRTVLEVAMTSDDEATRACAVRIINLFGERGDERYRDLLRLG